MIRVEADGDASGVREAVHFEAEGRVQIIQRGLAEIVNGAAGFGEGDAGLFHRIADDGLRLVVALMGPRGCRAWRISR